MKLLLIFAAVAGLSPNIALPTDAPASHPPAQMSMPASCDGKTFASAEEAQRSGCCSHHNGVCGCSDGRAKCCDGTLSPSCGCD